MPRYIDTEDFKHLINASSLYDTKEWVKVMNLLADTPTADVVERKMGKWTLNKEGNWACPFCEFDPYHDNMKGMNYCPNCGARLEGYDGEIH